MPTKYYYVAIEYYDKEGNRTRRSFVNERAFGCMYSFVSDISKAKLFTSLRMAKAFMKNYIKPTQSAIFYEITYI